ncbi:MAG: glycosyltransferase family 39 protein [Acidobacteria bacterium]|nr:glycosyltransferase family 39 protein [Acidobacteriota bacterium]
MTLEPFAIVLAAAFTVAVSAAAGSLFLKYFNFRSYRSEYWLFSFTTGSALLSLSVFALAVCRLARWESFLALGGVLLGLALWKSRGPGEKPSAEPIDKAQLVLFTTVYTVFTIIYFISALAPEVSPDGSSYHLGLVFRYVRERGFATVPANIYAYLSQGLEMLFLFAFPFGRHSAAALVHFACLTALVWSMAAYGRRFGFPAPAMAAALLVYLSPVVGADGTSAYNDVAAALDIFILFYLLEIWREQDQDSILAPTGLVAGFAFAIKYTAFVAVPFTLLVITARLWRDRRRLWRAVLVVSAFASVSILPWLAKNWITVSNPVAPFLNRWFPNPYVFVEFEDYYRAHFRTYGLPSLWSIPVEAAVRGEALQGFLGPVFLLAPVALLALRHRRGRSLLVAGLVFALPYAGNIGTRFLIPCLPFVALALALALGRSGRLAAVLVAAHAVLSWPAHTRWYAGPYAWRIERVPIRAALRLEREADYINFRNGGYEVVRMIDSLVPPYAKVFTISNVMEAYSSREILTGYQSARGNTMQQILWSPLANHYQPTGQMWFRFPPGAYNALRLVQTGTGVEDWAVNELRFFGNSRELERKPAWRLRANPNPWDVQMAFDNSLVTPWRARQQVFPGRSIQADFGRPELLDAALVQCACDVERLALKLEGRDESGGWKTLTGQPERLRVSLPEDLRRQATADLKALGIDYLLVFDSDYYAGDFRQQPGAWGLRLAGEKNGGRLYRIP